MMKVLLALEKTRISTGAIRILNTIKLPVGSDLFLLHVDPMPQQISDLAKERILKLSHEEEAIPDDVLEEGRQFLGKVEKRLRSQDVLFHPLVKKGYPGEEILKLIQSKNIDLVVLGTRGYSKAAGFVLGSVSQWVLKEAPCSVLIARTMSKQKKDVQGMKLLLATDGSRDSQAAVDFVRRLELPASSHITILHVVQKHVFETEQSLTADSKNEPEFKMLAEELLEDEGREGAKLLEQARKALFSPQLQIQERLVYGNPAGEIVKSARYLRADLIVMGSRGVTGLKRLFLGSVSNKIVHNVGCSVAVIRHKDQK